MRDAMDSDPIPGTATWRRKTALVRLAARERVVALRRRRCIEDQRDTEALQGPQTDASSAESLAPQHRADRGGVPAPASFAPSVGLEDDPPAGVTGDAFAEEGNQAGARFAVPISGDGSFDDCAPPDEASDTRPWPPKGATVAFFRLLEGLGDAPIGDGAGEGLASGRELLSPLLPLFEASGALTEAATDSDESISTESPKSI